MYKVDTLFPLPLKVSFFIDNGAIEKITLAVNKSALEWELLSENNEPLPSSLFTTIDRWMKAYVQNRPLPAIPLKERRLTSFGRTVYLKMEQIPFGQTLSYRELAEKAGKPLAARAVGNLCGVNPFPLVIPCHRVQKSDGGLGGFFGGIEIKKALLSFEHQMVASHGK